MSPAARLEAGMLLRRLQRGESLTLPHSRPMSTIGSRCHELRIRDRGANWRILFRIDPDAIMIIDVFSKKTAVTPQNVIDRARERLRRFDAI